MTWAFWGTTNGTISSNEPIDRDIHKKILFENKTDSTQLMIKVTSRYSDKNPLDSLVMGRLGLDPYPLSDDTLSFDIDGGSTRLIELSIMEDDSIAFPQSFNIDIYLKHESQKNTFYKRLDYEEFKKYATAEQMRNDSNFLTANGWTLELDSTFLDLKSKKAK